MKRLALALLTTTFALGAFAQQAPAAPPAGGDKGTAAFKRLDTNGDGKISADEAKANKHMAKGFSKADLNGDGTVSSDEMKQARAAQKKIRDEKRAANPSKQPKPAPQTQAQ